MKLACPILCELRNFEKKLKTENSSDSEKQTLCNRVEQLVEKLDKIYADSFRTIKQDYRSGKLMDLSNIRDHYRDLIQQYGQSKDCGHQTSFVSSTSTGDKDSKETVIDKRNGVLENAEENVEVFSGILLQKKAEKNPVSSTRDHGEDDRLTKWITIDEEVKTQIPEADRPPK